MQIHTAVQSEDGMWFYFGGITLCVQSNAL